MRKKKVEEQEVVIHGFKGFDKDMKCRGFQFEEGKEYEESDAIICEKGFHFCENPLDVWNYYNLCDSEYATVIGSGKVVGHNDDSKKASTKLKIVAKLSLAGFIKASVDFLLKTTKQNTDTAASGHYSQLAASGDSSKLEITGLDSVGAAVGINNAIKGKVGNWITLAEWEYNNKKKSSVPVCVKSAQIDGKTIKADTWYTLKDGEFVEVTA